MPSRFRRPSPGSLLLVFLTAILAMSLGLGYHALSTARSHRATVESALRDFASMASWQFSRVARENLTSVLRWAFDDVLGRWRGRDLPDPGLVARELGRAVRYQRCECRDLQSPILYFRIDLRNNRVVSLPDTVSAATLTRLADTLATHGQLHPNVRIGLITAPAGAIVDSSALVAYAVARNRDGAALAIYGFVAKPDALGDLFSMWYSTNALLPPAIVGSLPNDSLLHLVVRASDGARVFESGASYPTAYAARDTIGEEYGGVFVEASVRPEAAARLVIGGLPRARLPLILGLLMLSLGLGTAAVFLVRREHQLARLRDEFVSGVSHELRTPLAQIRMFAELLDDGKLRTDAERERSLKVINREARRLALLVENILQFSWLRRRSGGLAIESTDAEETVREVIEVFRPLARSLDVEFQADVEAGAVIAADRDAVKQILLNLVDNALKYGPRGQTVAIAAVRSGDKIRLSVQDQGPGIPHRDRQRVWEPYQRLAHTAKGTFGGTGIGLAVVERLVALHRGRAWVEDAPGTGAQFVVELSQAQAESEAGGA